MSETAGTGQSQFLAPGALAPATGDQPLVGPDGRPTFYMLQWMQRVVSYLGQPSGSSETITEQIGTIGAEAALALAQSVTNNTTSVSTSVTAAASAAAIGAVQALAAPNIAPAIARFRAQLWFAAGQGP